MEINKPFRCKTEKDSRVGLTVNIDGSMKPTIWSAKRKVNLTWKNVSKTPDEPLLKAMKYWQSACGIKFSKVDSNPFFTFRDSTAQEEKDLPGVIAFAFFPGNTPREVVLLSIFNSQFNKVPILAHELGHMLGFRHEHIWIGLTRESTVGAKPVTKYDKNSIMHYQRLWDDSAKKVLTKLSTLDITGARLIYGNPIGASSFFNEINNSVISCHTVEKEAEEILSGAIGQLTLENLGKNDKVSPIWSKDTRQRLTWRNDSSAKKSELIQAMNWWQSVCGIKFIEQPDKPLFTFRDALPNEEAAPRKPIAYAFFPSMKEREVVLFRSWKTQNIRVSILAHELGHVLGFRHEHIWIGFNEETTEGAVQLTDYDENSIMNYKKMYDDSDAGKITKPSKLDSLGAQVIYGLPLSSPIKFFEIKE